MTARAIKFLFRLYHLIFVSPLPSCRFEPTCSKYFLDAVEKHGVLKGSALSAKRLLSCHPLSKRPLYDPA